MVTNELPWELMVAIVIALATIQSLLGVGLLLFGTPALLMLHLSFPEALAYLLPCSLAISIMQVITSGGFTLEPIRRNFLIYTAPWVVVGTTVTVFFSSPEQINLVVGGMLLGTAALRLFAPGQRLVKAYVSSHLRGLLVSLGLVHGLSNLGGGILTGIVGSTFEDKFAVRRHIAFCYGVMAALQLAVVLVGGINVDPVLEVALPGCAVTVYLVVGQWLFIRVPREAYQHALTGLLFAFGIVLVTR